MVTDHSTVSIGVTPHFNAIIKFYMLIYRGKQSLETICLILAYKVKYPEKIFLLRGNHECASINR